MKRSKLLFIAGILGGLYIIYLISYFTGSLGSSEGAESLGAGLATLIVMPHMICVGIAVIFNWIGWALMVRWAALVSGILYAISMVLMPIYAFFVLLQTIFCFIAFAKIKKYEDSIEKFA